jgi:hypothetical protein
VAWDEAASMFAGQPQPVEIHHRGIWYTGELTGWRHESNGRVAARVRCRVDGLRHSTWKDLADLRLPDPKHPPRREPFTAVVRRPVPAFLQDDEDDATRPHALLAGMRTRPAKPVHATTPPAPRAAEPIAPIAPVEPARWTEPSPRQRRNERLHQLDAYLSVV